MKLKFILFCTSAMMVAGSTFAQSKVSTNGQKYTLVEEATGTWCQWCPDGAQVIEEAILPHGSSANYPRAIIASFHNGASDSMLIATDPFSNGTGYITGFPMGTVDRAPYSSSSVGLSRNAWAPAVGVRNGLTPNFDVSMTCLYDSATRVISIKVKAKALVACTGPYRINAYITEDSISSAPIGYRQTVGSGITGAGSVSSTGSPTWYIGQSSPLNSPTIYCHMAAVRRILATTSTGGIWGDAAFPTTIAVGDSFEKSYTDTIPMTYRGRSCYKYYTNVVGLVQKYGTSSSDRAIDNCIQAKVRLMWKTLPSTGVTDITTMQAIQLYPNPAQNTITVKGVLENPSETKIAIFNAIGQTVYTQEFKAGGSIFGEVLPISHLSNGVYFMNISNNGESVTKEFTVSK